MAPLRLLSLLPLAATTFASILHPQAPITSFSSNDDDDDTPLPVIIWHGLGDNYAADGLSEVATLLDTVNPGTYTYIIRLGSDPNADRSATFLGNVTEQVEDVCEQIKADPILSTAPAINALGFSQGGQFLRGLVERCEGAPRVSTLVTFGSQHNGISEFQACASRGDWVCRGAEALLRSGTWSNFVQSRLVPAQYFRDPEELESYLEHSNFLADVNNEREVKNVAYAERMAALDKFVMYTFEEDKTVVPVASGHFAEVNRTSGEITPLRKRQMYKEDWLGLKKLDQKGGLVFGTVPGEHMQLDWDTLANIFKKYYSWEAYSGKKDYVIQEEL